MKHNTLHTTYTQSKRARTHAATPGENTVSSLEKNKIENLVSTDCPFLFIF